MSSGWSSRFCFFVSRSCSRSVEVLGKLRVHIADLERASQYGRQVHPKASYAVVGDDTVR